jgi:hypothetical protein
MRLHTDTRPWLVNRTTVLAESLTSRSLSALTGTIGIVRRHRSLTAIGHFQPLVEISDQVHHLFGFDTWKREACRRPGFLSLVSY